MNSRLDALAAFAALAALAACGTPPTPASPRPATASAPALSSSPLVTTATSANADAGASGDALLPSTAAGTQLAWVLAPFKSGGRMPSAVDLKSHFAQLFLDKVPMDQLLTVFKQLAGTAAPLTIVRVEPNATDAKLSIVVHSDAAGFMRVGIATDATDAHQILGLAIQAAPDLAPQAASWDEVDKNVQAVAPMTNLLAAEITGNTCATVHALDSAKPLALGSAFKLYVLSAIAHDVATGKRKWTDTLAIDDAKKSLPSGTMQTEAAGKTFTVQQFAEKMISISDNTAADHLLLAVGRDAVEAAVVSAGGANASLDTPFLTTRELFVFKLLLAPAEQQEYVAADVVAKRKLLAGYDKRDLAPALSAAEAWTAPRFIDKVEWFASPDDLCKVALTLKAYSEKPQTEAVAGILAINPGIPDASDDWKYIGFKGGGEPGVMNLSWILQRARDGKWFFLTVGFNNTGSPIDDVKGLTAATMALTFLAK